MILKASHNIRLDKDLNISFATEGVVDTEEEAEAMGEESARYMKRYMAAFGEQFGDKEDDDED